VKKLLSLLVITGMLTSTTSHNPFTSTSSAALKGDHTSKEKVTEAISSSEAKVTKYGHWPKPPTVILCSSAPIKKLKVQQAITWWRKRGHRFAALVEETPGNFTESICADPMSQQPRGYIVITRMTEDAVDDERDLALTRYRRNRRMEVVIWAKIFINPGYDSGYVLEHELGHAVGFLHLVREGHLMHPEIPNGGWNDDGLTK